MLRRTTVLYFKGKTLRELANSCDKKMPYIIVMPRELRRSLLEADQHMNININDIEVRCSLYRAIPVIDDHVDELPPGELYTRKEAASVLRVSHWTIRTMIRNGDIKEIKLDNYHRLISANEIKRFIDSHQET